MTSYKFTTGKTLDAKPYDDDTGYVSPWDDDLITATERQFGGTGTGVYDFELTSPKLHYIYERLGASPAGPDAATPDNLVGYFPAKGLSAEDVRTEIDANSTKIAAIQTEVDKIPRGASSITPGSFVMAIGVNDAEVTYSEPA